MFGDTVAQHVVAVFVPGIERFEDKAFPVRLVVSPLMMLAAPAVWWWHHQRRTNGSDPALWGRSRCSARAKVAPTNTLGTRIALMHS